MLIPEEKRYKYSRINGDTFIYASCAIMFVSKLILCAITIIKLVPQSVDYLQGEINLLGWWVVFMSIALLNIQWNKKFFTLCFDFRSYVLAFSKSNVRILTHSGWITIRWQDIEEIISVRRFNNEVPGFILKSEVYVDGLSMDAIIKNRKKFNVDLLVEFPINYGSDNVFTSAEALLKNSR